MDMYGCVAGPNAPSPVLLFEQKGSTSHIEGIMKIFPSVGIFSKRIDRHTEDIQGSLVTSSAYKMLTGKTNALIKT